MATVLERATPTARALPLREARSRCAFLGEPQAWRGGPRAFFSFLFFRFPHPISPLSQTKKPRTQTESGAGGGGGGAAGSAAQGTDEQVIRTLRAELNGLRGFKATGATSSDPDWLRAKIAEWKRQHPSESAHEDATSAGKDARGRGSTVLAQA